MWAANLHWTVHDLGLLSTDEVVHQWDLLFVYRARFAKELLASSLKFHKVVLLVRGHVPFPLSCMTGNFVAEATTWWARAAARQSCTFRTEVGLMVDEGTRMVFSFRVQKGYSPLTAGGGS